MPPEPDKYIKRTPSGGSSSQIVARTCQQKEQSHACQQC